MPVPSGKRPPLVGARTSAPAPTTTTTRPTTTAPPPRAAAPAPRTAPPQRTAPPRPAAEEEFDDQTVQAAVAETAESPTEEAPTEIARPARAAAPPPRATAGTVARQAQPAAPASAAMVHRPSQAVVPSKRDELPEYLKDRYGDRSGTEDVDRGDIIIPRLGLCQSLTPQGRKSNPQYIEGLEEGMFFNTATNVIYGAWVNVIPLFFAKSRIKFNPIDSGGGIDCQSLNGKTGGHYSPASCTDCQYSQWNDGETPECTLFHNFLGLIVEDESQQVTQPEIIVVSMKSTALKISKQWNAKVRMLNLPMYSAVYRITAVDETRNNNTFKQVVVNRTNQSAYVIPRGQPGAGFVIPDIFQECEANFQALREKNIQVDTTGADAEEDAERHGRVTDFNTAEM